MVEKTKAALRGKPFIKGDPRAGRPKGSRNARTIEIEAVARGLLEDVAYQANLRVRLLSGEAPHMETLLHHYAYGKPMERYEHSGPDGKPLAVTIYVPDNQRP